MGYSNTPLQKKLGIKPGMRIKTRNAPDQYRSLLEPLPPSVAMSSRLRSGIDMWHLFTANYRELADSLPVAMAEIKQEGMIWVSWPKKSSGVASEITEDAIRECALPLGLVDIKVCAIDDVWSGLKLVIRKENRR